MLVRTAFGLPTWKQPKLDVNRRTTLIIDECGMADSDKHSRALRHAEKAGCRVVLVGDHRQLPAIGPGGLFRELWERAHGDQKTVLTDIVRQREV
jgi:ATP-dependent exoDNAse (exonuclease V) alpha subunit